jgi:hypothetical protein
MKKIGTLILLIGMMCLFLSADSFAQRGIKWKGSSGWGPRGQYSRMYDTTTVKTFTAEVISVDTLTPMKGMSYGVHLMVKTEQETLSVHLGPAWYVENQDTKIEPKDTVEIKGSRISFQGKPTVIAATIRKGEELITLRDEKGFPVWSGWRRR